MNLTPMGANMTELTLKDYSVLFSYRTPVAARYLRPSGYSKVVKTSKFWSNTTSKHISTWLKSFGYNGVLDVEPQEFFDNLIAGVK